MSLFEATQAAVEAARDDLSPKDDGAVKALLLLARRIDAWGQIVEWALEDVEGTKKRPKVPANDNVSLPTYLRYCEALHLTPASREKLPKLPKQEAKPVGRVDELEAKRRRREAER